MRLQNGLTKAIAYDNIDLMGGALWRHTQTLSVIINFLPSKKSKPLKTHPIHSYKGIRILKISDFFPPQNPQSHAFRDCGVSIFSNVRNFSKDIHVLFQTKEFLRLSRHCVKGVRDFRSYSAPKIEGFPSFLLIKYLLRRATVKIEKIRSKQLKFQKKNRQNFQKDTSKILSEKSSVEIDQTKWVGLKIPRHF